MVVLCSLASCNGQDVEVATPSGTPADRDRSLDGLVTAITVTDSDLTSDGSLTPQKAEIVAAASAELVRHSDRAVPELIPLVRLVYSALRHESLTGWNAVNVITAIGAPALPYVRNSSEELGDIGDHIVRTIEGHNGSSE